MKTLRTIGIIGVVLLMLSVTPLLAQEAEIGIAYGETVHGEITNQQFDVVYVFNGEAGDIVMINLIRDETASFDPYLYLTTPENDILARNDDFFSLNSRIIAQLPNDGDFWIVATRLSERSGSGEGGYQLSLEQGRVGNVDSTIEGQVTLDDVPPTHIFIPETTGVYAIEYNHVRGAYFPSMVVSLISPDNYYEEDIAQISGRGLQGGTVRVQLEANSIYVLTLEQNPYDYSASSGDFALYTMRVTLPE